MVLPIRYSPFIMLCLGSLEMDRVIREQCYKVTVVHSNYRKNDHLGALPLPCGPRQANSVLIAYASSEGSGEPAHKRSLARTFAARSYKQRVKWNLQTESQIPGPSEWLGMRS